MRTFLKLAIRYIFLVLLWPFGASTAFGRIGVMHRLWAHTVAFIPGLPGDYCRISYYYWTLRHCALDSRIEFGTFLPHPQAQIHSRVYIGSYCILGRVSIGPRSQIASGVQILSGRHQHRRDSSGSIGGADTGDFVPVSIGEDCWIGAGAIIMADVGQGTTVGAGSVVVKPLPAEVVAVGNPARVLS